MKKTILKYRLPGDTVRNQKGIFDLIQRDELQGFQGFVVGDFQLDKVYGFYPGLEDSSELSVKAPVIMNKETYFEIASNYIEKMQDGNFDKIILSRVQKEKLTRGQDLIFDALCKAYPSAFVYLISSPHFGTWIGATPERLLQKDDVKAMVVALAGTKLSIDESPWRKKEIEEQAYVTEFLKKRLEKNKVRDLRVTGPGELIAGPVKHLYTELTFDNSIDVWKIIQAIHPTPAVCGMPQDLTREIILRTEPHNRSLYSGVIGLINENKVDLFVNLRCGQIIDNEIFMFLGGGLTRYSDPEEEWLETMNKAKTLSAFL